MARRPFLHPFTPPALEDHVTIVRGEGAHVWDDAGNEYVDALGALWFCNVGYARPEVVEAISNQTATLHAFHCFSPFTNEPAEELAERIAALAPVDDPRVFLTSSGSEALDSAIKLARLSHQWAGDTERRLIVSRERGYHGVTYGGLSAQGLAANKEGFGPFVDEVIQVPADDIEALATLFATRGEEIAAFVTEPVQGAGGVFPPPEGYLAHARRLCDDHGAYLIADEVICAFGRLGHWFGSEHYDVRPDLATFAKGVSSGYVPLGGVVLSDRVCAPLEADPAAVLRHGHTYSGHATAAAAGLACMQVTEDEGLLDRATVIGRRLWEGLGALVADGTYPGMRGEGAVWALETGDRSPVDVRDRAMAAGVIVRPLGDCVAVCPPLVISDADVDRIIDVLAEV